MSANMKVVRVVLASPSDVQKERDRVPLVVDEVNRNVARERGILLELYRWETEAQPGFHELGPQGLIDERLRIERCDLLVGVFWRRIGTPTLAGRTGTVDEFLHAYDCWQRTRSPQIMVYFGQKAYTPQSAEEAQQWAEVLSFKKDFPVQGLHWEYEDEDVFERLLRNHLTKFVQACDAGPGPSERAGAGARPLRACPYNFTLPAEGRMFKGHRQELAEILPRIQAGSSYAIVGGTRSGKTSLLYELKRILLQQLDVEEETGYVIGPVFLSTHELSPLSQAAIYQQIVSEFEKSVWKKKFSHVPFVQGKLFDPNLKEEQAFPAFCDVLERIVRMASNDLKIVIMIDEIDELQRYGWSRDMFINLRHLISQSRLNRNVSMIISGTLQLFTLYAVAGSPFLNVISGTKRMLLLPEADALQLIQEPIGHRLQESVAQYVLQQTGGHPFLIQYLMTNLWWNFGGEMQGVGRPDVDRVVGLFLKERNDFREWASKFTEHAKDVYRFIARRGGPVEKAEIIDLVGDPEAAVYALEILAHVCVVREVEENTYLLGGLMFKTWFFSLSDRPKSGTAGAG